MYAETEKLDYKNKEHKFKDAFPGSIFKIIIITVRILASNLILLSTGILEFLWE
jgi:hypothetical protein